MLFEIRQNIIMRKDKRYDFADEAPYKNSKDIVVEEEKYRGLKIKRIEVLSNKNTYHDKGNYLSFEVDNIDTDKLSKYKIEIIIKELKKLLSKINLCRNPHILMVGLGNDDFSSDALGPETIKRINANSYLEDQDSKVSCIIPGVMRTTGLESASIIKSLVDKFKFDLVVVFDSLATRNINRLYKVIQITDTQIIPGSGIKNFRKSFNASYLGVPIIAVGVSMAITYENIVEDILNHIDYHKELSHENKKYLVEQLENDMVLTSKDTELRVKNIGLNLSMIFNQLFL